MVKHITHIAYHVIVVVLSAAVALSLPYSLGFAAAQFLRYWALIENEKVFLVSVEIAAAVLIILLVNSLRRGWSDRRGSRMARLAGLLRIVPSRGFLSRRRIAALKQRQGRGRDITVIGSTGYRTLVDPEGELHDVVQRCREARIMLLHPFGEGALARAKSLRDPAITPESFREQILATILFLKKLRAFQKNISLKLYHEAPLWKMAVIGDYLFLKHYDAGTDVGGLPEYVFRHGHVPGGLFGALSQYALGRWRDPSLPEYDLVTDELVWRDREGGELRREPFGPRQQADGRS